MLIYYKLTKGAHKRVRATGDSKMLLNLSRDLVINKEPRDDLNLNRERLKFN